MDIDYRKPSAELVFDLINRDNPQLPFKLVSSTTLLGKPSVLTVPADFVTPVTTGRNTKISFSPKDASGYLGSAVVNYRRLDPTRLFPQGKVIVDGWSNDPSYLTVATVLGWINAKYGTALVMADVASQTGWGNAATKNTAQTVTLAFAATCPAFVGTFTIDRRAAKQPINQLVPDTTANILQLSAGVTPGPAADNVADWLTFSGDFSKFSTYLATLTALTTLPASLKVQELIKYMGLLTGLPLDISVAATTRNGMAGCRAIKYALPNVNVPEANSVDYNNVVVITPPAAGGWFVGRFLLHYKV